MKVNLDNVRLETERLVLRPFLESDLDDLFEYASVDGVGEMAGWKHHENTEQTKKVLDTFIAEKDVFAIVHKEKNKVVGSFGLHQGTRLYEDKARSHLKAVEFGYVLSKNFWGQGLALEAAKAATKYCFDILGLDAIICTHSIDNPQSKRVIEKSGFRYLYPAVLYDEATDTCTEGMLYILEKATV